VNDAPKLFTARFFAEQVLSSDAVVPVRISMRPPIIPLGYALEETACSLLPEPWMVGEWPWLSPTYWRALDARGAETIGAELAAISERHGDHALALLDYEDVVKGDRSLRVVFASWWEKTTGEPVKELLDDGRALHNSQLPRRARAKPPKDPRQDHRWTNDEVRPWPLSHDDVAAWIANRHWQQARSQVNPHSYTRRDWGSEKMFLRVVLHIREHGEQERFAGDTYTYFVVGKSKFWTMGADLESTVILNRKQLGVVGEETKNLEPKPVLFDGEEST
jgi:hypothetical protein